MRLPRLQPGDRLSAELVNGILDAIERLENMTADPSSGIELVRSAGGIALRLSGMDSSSGGGGGDWVRVTSSTMDPTSKMWPAFLQTVADGTPPTFADGVAVWAHAANGGPLSAGLPSTYLPAAFLLTHSDGKDVYGVAGTAVDILCNVSGQPTIVTA